MSAYYNEHDPFAAQWLRTLIEAGEIAPGYVDERSIEDVRPDELSGYSQCHFFAGIGVWSYALRMAGVPDDYPVWTGSCPCQPFSAAGKGDGFADERHLWPAFFHLIEQCEPTVVFGEQVAASRVGVWFDLVQADMEGMGYAFGLVPMPAAGFGGAHIRDRAFWVADSENIGHERSRTAWRMGNGSKDGGDDSRMAHANGGDGGAEWIQHGGKFGLIEKDGGALRCADSGTWDNIPGVLGRTSSHPTGWDDIDWLLCRDAKWRPVEAGTFPLANEAPARLGRLRGYGNAIDAETTTAFIKAFIGV